MDFTLQTLDHLKPLIQGFRKQANLTQAAMAEKLGISQQSYAQIESNLASTSVERLFTILRLLHVNIQLTDGNPETMPAIRVTPRAKKSRALQQTARIAGPSNAKRTASYVSNATPAKVTKPNDTTKW